MAAAMTTTATTIEAQILEVATEMQTQESAAAAADETFEERVTISPDTEGGTVTISLTLPVTVSGSGGALQFTPSEYLP